MYKYDHKKKEVQLVDPFVIEYDHHVLSMLLLEKIMDLTHWKLQTTTNQRNKQF